MVIRYRKKPEGLSAPDFVFGLLLGAGLMAALAPLYVDYKRDCQKPDVVSVPVPASTPEKKPVYASDDEVEVRYSISLPNEKRCWTSVALTTSDLPMLRADIRDAARREGVGWHEVDRCPSDYEGGCSHSFHDPSRIMTVYTYDADDAKSLRDACTRSNDGSAWVNPM